MPSIFLLGYSFKYKQPNANRCLVLHLHRIRLPDDSKYNQHLSLISMEGKISYHDHNFSRSSFQRVKSSSIDSARRALQNTRSSAKIQKPSQRCFFIWVRHSCCFRKLSKNWKIRFRLKPPPPPPPSSLLGSVPRRGGFNSASMLFTFAEKGI